MRLPGKMLISPWLLCPLLGLLLLYASLINYPGLLKLEYPVYDQWLAFKATTTSQKVVLVTNNRGDTEKNLPTLLAEINRRGGKTITLLTSFSSTEQPAEKNLISGAEPLPKFQQLLFNLQNPLANYRLNHPVNRIAATQAPFGHLIFSPDPDGKIRSQALLIPWKKQLIPSLPLSLAAQVLGENLQDLQIPPAELAGTLQIHKLQIPVIGDYRMLLNVCPEHSLFQIYSAANLLQGDLKQDELQGKVVLIGPTNSYGDQHQVAGYGEMSTSELAALTTATLLTNSAPQRPDWAWLVETVVLLYFAILIMFLIPRLSFRAGLTTLLLFLISWILMTAGSMIFFSIWLKVVPVILLSLSGFILIQWHIRTREIYCCKQENLKILAQRFQEQGLADMALEKALLIEPDTKSSKVILYNLGLEFERKRMLHNAISVYQHLSQAGRYRDSKDRLKQLENQNMTPFSNSNDNTIILPRSGEKPMLGRYQIERELGQGAMGTVYLGFDQKINRQVAIKTLGYQQVDPAELPEIKERFFREAEAVGKLSHPNIVTIYDVGEEPDLAFFAMELLEGKALSYCCQPENLLPVAQAIDIISQTTAALDYAHRQGIIHRDIKPANIILLQEGQIKVTDFGIARITASSRTETGIILGTPSYMSPEQVAGKKVDGRSDLFSLGIVMYELLCGEKPFQGENMTALMYNISRSSYRPLAEIRRELPALCYTIVDRLLQKALTRRFKSATILQQELLVLQKELEK